MHKLIALTCSLLLILNPFAFAEKATTLKAFKGLERSPVAAKINDGAHTTFDNAYIKDGNLRNVLGRDRLNSTAIADTTVEGFFYYENTSGVKKLIVKEADEIVSYAIDGTGRTSILGSLTDEAIDCEQIGNTLYCTSATDGLIKWTGTGAAAAVGTSATPSSVNFAATSNPGALTSGLEAIVLPETSATAAYSYYSGGACILAPTFLSDSEEFGTDCDSLSASWTKTCATSTTYSYKVTNYNSKWGIESEASTVDTATLEGAEAFTATGVDCFVMFSDGACANSVGTFCRNVASYVTGAQTQTTGTLVAPSDPYNQVRVYRTVSGGSQYFLVGQAAAGAYKDGKPDVALGDPFDSTIDTIAPPSFPYIGTYKGVIVVGEGNTLRFNHVPVNADTDMDTYWLETDQINLSTNQIITGMVGIREALLIFTTTDIYAITGYGVGSFRLKEFAHSVGAVSNATISADTNGDIIFFAGVPGVYKLQVGGQVTDSLSGVTIDRSDTTMKKLSSPTMDDVFRGQDSEIVLDPADFASSHAYYDIDNDLYFLYIDNQCFIFDNENQVWSRMPATQMVASVFRKSANASGQGVLIDNKGFMYDNWTGNENGIESGTVTGNPTASTNNTLTDSGASFNTTNDGLAGIWVAIEDGTTGELEYNQIASNTGTVLTMVSNWVDNPGTDDTYYIAYVNVDIITKQYSLIDPPGETDLYKLQLIHERSDASQTLAIDHYINKSATTEGQKTIDLATNLIDPLGISGRGSWHQFRFRTQIYNTSATINPPVNIENYTFQAIGREAE